MKEYDLIVVGTGSAMNLVNPLLNENPEAKIAIIDKDAPGGICLTRGCIPSKMILYPAEVIRTVEAAQMLGINVELKLPDFKFIMERMRKHIGAEIGQIRKGLSNAENIDYYTDTATFVEPKVLQVGKEIITAKLIFLCLGSRPHIPKAFKRSETDFLTSSSFLELKKLPKSLLIVGGGYIAAEYGHFMATMGSEVTIIGRNPQFLPSLEPEVSRLAARKLGKHMTIITNHEAVELNNEKGLKVIKAIERKSGEAKLFKAEEVLIAVGREATTDLINPETGEVEVDEKGWIVVDEHMRASVEGVWAFGDAIGGYLYKHVANYESIVALYNLFGQEREVSYHAVPWAVFTYPEIAGVGMNQAEAVERLGEEEVLVGFQRYIDTAKGKAMESADYFVKVLVTKEDQVILGCHIIGPHASILVQEVVNLMNTPSRSYIPYFEGMHIHPSLSEVVERAFGSLMPVNQYNHILHHYGLGDPNEPHEPHSHH